MFVEQIELPQVVVSDHDGLIVTAYLTEMGLLEVHGELHQGIRDVGGGFVGDGIFRAFGRHGGSLNVYSPIASFMRKLLPSMMTVSA